MKTFRWLAFSLTFFLIACQPDNSSAITILDNGQIQIINSVERVPLLLFTQNGITFQPNDSVLLNGITVPLDRPIPETDQIQLQLRRAVTLTLVTPQGQQTISSSAFTVGQALTDAGYALTKNDLINPSSETPITQDLTITYTPARELSILIGDREIKVRSAARTVGDALAEAGIPLMGTDTSSPAESEAPPADGSQISVVRIRETIEVALKPIPFTEEVVTSPEVPFGEKETIQPGVEGLAMTRTRVRYENGIEVSRAQEDETVMREPQKRIVQSGEKIVLSPVGGNNPNEYWTAVEMYATVYSPCASGTGGCSYGTASGARAGYGIVAVDYSIYSYLAGMRVYIPGYGTGTIGDTGGGPIIESAFGVPRTKWIDLGYNDGELGNISGWVTVYFLAPAPAEIPYFMK
jgi:uncharacterized protein YabE (DUF348 family)